MPAQCRLSPLFPAGCDSFRIWRTEKPCSDFSFHGTPLIQTEKRVGLSASRHHLRQNDKTATPPAFCFQNPCFLKFLLAASVISPFPSWHAPCAPGAGLEANGAGEPGCAVGMHGQAHSGLCSPCAGCVVVFHTVDMPIKRAPVAGTFCYASCQFVTPLYRFCNGPNCPKFLIINICYGVTLRRGYIYSLPFHRRLFALQCSLSHARCWLPQLGRRLLSPVRHCAAFAPEIRGNPHLSAVIGSTFFVRPSCPTFASPPCFSSRSPLRPVPLVPAVSRLLPDRAECATPS